MHDLFALFDSAPIGVYRLNAEGQILEMNPAGANLLNIASRDLYHKTLKNFLCPLTHATYNQFLHNLVHEGRSNGCEVRLMADRGEVFCELKGMVERAENDQRYYFITLSDTSQANVSKLYSAAAGDRLKIALEASSAGIITLI